METDKALADWVVDLPPPVSSDFGQRKKFYGLELKALYAEDS